MTQKHVNNTNYFPIVTVIINVPSTRCIAMLKVTDILYLIVQYDINTNDTLMEIPIQG